jgi:hypothetical protein
MQEGRGEALIAVLCAPDANLGIVAGGDLPQARHGLIEQLFGHARGEVLILAGRCQDDQSESSLKVLDGDDLVLGRRGRQWVRVELLGQFLVPLRLLLPEEGPQDAPSHGVEPEQQPQGHDGHHHIPAIAVEKLLDGFGESIRERFGGVLDRHDDRINEVLDEIGS